MTRLLLYRHAKSDWGDARLADKDRPLNARGRSAAPLMARYIVEAGLLPDRILCSTSQRTRETLLPLLTLLDRPADIHLREEVYDRSDEDYLGVIRQFGGHAHTLMIVGHNPATEASARSLVKDRSGPDWIDLAVKFPTAGLAVIDFQHSDWSQITLQSGRLDRFIKPRALERESTHPPAELG
ncbi:MAG: histidine phosphatase family protein [Roseibium sp.]|nr:histidine phosphatase family protein [Roseibium sp.]